MRLPPGHFAGHFGAVGGEGRHHNDGCTSPPQYGSQSKAIHPEKKGYQSSTSSPIIPSIAIATTSPGFPSRPRNVSTAIERARRGWQAHAPLQARVSVPPKYGPSSPIQVHHLPSYQGMSRAVRAESTRANSQVRCIRTADSGGVCARCSEYSSDGRSVGAYLVGGWPLCCGWSAARCRHHRWEHSLSRTGRGHRAAAFRERKLLGSTPRPHGVQH